MELKRNVIYSFNKDNDFILHFINSEGFSRSFRINNDEKILSIILGAEEDSTFKTEINFADADFELTMDVLSQLSNYYVDKEKFITIYNEMLNEQKQVSETS